MIEKRREITASSLNAVSVTGQIDTLQQLLNDTASAPNYQLESKTIQTYQLIRDLDELHTEDGQKKNNTRMLFDAWIEWLADWDN